MKPVCHSTLMLLAICLVAGCSSNDDSPEKSENATSHPKYPDLFVTINGADGHSGELYWHKNEDGYDTYQNNLTDSTSNGTHAAVKTVYTGTSEAGDAYTLEVKVGDAKESKNVIYKGKRFEIDIADGVKFILEPDPL